MVGKAPKPGAISYSSDSDTNGDGPPVYVPRNRRGRVAPYPRRQVKRDRDHEAYKAWLRKIRKERAEEDFWLSVRVRHRDPSLFGWKYRKKLQASSSSPSESRSAASTSPDELFLNDSSILLSPLPQEERQQEEEEEYQEEEQTEDKEKQEEKKQQQ